MKTEFHSLFVGTTENHGKKWQISWQTLAKIMNIAVKSQHQFTHQNVKFLLVHVFIL